MASGTQVYACFRIQYQFYKYIYMLIEDFVMILYFLYFVHFVRVSNIVPALLQGGI